MAKCEVCGKGVTFGKNTATPTFVPTGNGNQMSRGLK